MQPIITDVSFHKQRNPSVNFDSNLCCLIGRDLHEVQNKLIQNMQMRETALKNALLQYENEALTKYNQTDLASKFGKKSRFDDINMNPYILEAKEAGDYVVTKMSNLRESAPMKELEKSILGYGTHYNEVLNMIKKYIPNFQHVPFKSSAMLAGIFFAGISVFVSTLSDKGSQRTT